MFADCYVGVFGRALDLCTHMRYSNLSPLWLIFSCTRPRLERRDASIRSTGCGTQLPMHLCCELMAILQQLLDSPYEECVCFFFTAGIVCH